MIKIIRIVLNKSIFAILASQVLLISLAAQPSGNQKNVCKADVKKYCGEVQPGDGKIIQCLISNESRLSQACKLHVGNWNNVRFACQQDQQKYCKGLTNAKLQQCIRKNRKNFSAACKGAVNKARGM